MPTLMGLPNEILISIIEATEPEDIESFSTCCKLMYGLARHRLEEHKEKKRLFSHFSVDFCKPNTHLDTQLRKLFSDERNRLYPATMAVSLLHGYKLMKEYEDSRTARTSSINGLDKFEQQLDSRMAEVHSMIGLEIGGTEAEEWGKHVKAGDSIATFLFLLALLPNLEKFSVAIVGDWPQMLSANYSRIIRLMTRAILEHEKNGLSFGGKLSECEVYGDFDGDIEASLLPLFMVLPRMQKIQGCSLAMENCFWPYADAVSQVVDLDLHGAIDAVTLDEYIRGIRELKKFRFAYASCNNVDWEPWGIVATLRQFAFRSLVYLNLTTDVPFEVDFIDISPGIGSLRSFEVLETVRLHYVLLLEEVWTANSADEVNSAETSENLLDKPLIKGQNLVDFLPSSVRVFELEDIAEGELILDTFEGFPDDRVELLPNLRLIKLDAGDETNSQIEKICKKAGVLWMKAGEEKSL